MTKTTSIKWHNCPPFRFRRRQFGHVIPHRFLRKAGELESGLRQVIPPGISCAVLLWDGHGMGFGTNRTKDELIAELLVWLAHLGYR